MQPISEGDFAQKLSKGTLKKKAKSRKVDEIPWTRSDAKKRYCMLPWEIMGDPRCGGAEALVFASMQAKAFIVRGNIVKISQSWLTKASKLKSRNTTSAALNVLIECGYIEVMDAARNGSSGIYKLASPMFASKKFIVTDETGVNEVARENIEAFRKRLKVKRTA
jgi:hypothetical protein